MEESKTSRRKKTRAPKTFRDKMRPGMAPQVKEDSRGNGLMLIPTPELVAEVLREIPTGRLLTASALRERLAARHGAQFTCPLTTGIFLGIVAGASQEAALAGGEPLAPYWRVVTDKGALLPKLPGGVEHQAELLRAEGHELCAGRGNAPPRVADLQGRLA